MKKTTHMPSIALLALIVLAGCASTSGPQASHGPRPDGRYDNHAYLVNPARMDLAKVTSSIVTLVTKTRFAVSGGRSVTVTLEGSGVVVGRRHVLTVEHSVSQHVLRIATPAGMMSLRAKKMGEKTYVRWKGKEHLLRPLLKSRAEDIALFKLPREVRPPVFPYRLGNSDDLRVGNYVYVVGNPLNLGVNVREGIVSALRAPKQIEQVHAKRENTFMVSNGVVPGDSGTPIIAIRDGRYELVGLTQGTLNQVSRLGWGIRINKIREMLEVAIAGAGSKKRAPGWLALASTPGKTAKGARSQGPGPTPGTPIGLWSAFHALRIHTKSQAAVHP